MKYSLNNRQEHSYLKKADEILIQFRDRKALPDYAEKYPEAALVLDAHPTDMPLQMTEIKEYFVLAQGRLTLSLPIINEETLAPLRELGVPYFYAYPATNGYELEALVKAGVSQVRIDAPLFFDSRTLQSYNIPKRVVANVAHEGYIPTTDGICGSWIRPEDVAMYEDIFTTIEFRDTDNHKEQALYRIYAEQHAWPGDLDMLITNINTIGKVNRMLPPEFTKARLSCRQVCKQGNSCQVCHRFIRLADPARMQQYLDSISS